MSGERLSVDTSVEIPKDTKLDSGPKKNNVKISNRVNINHLLSKVRE